MSGIWNIDFARLLQLHIHKIPTRRMCYNRLVIRQINYAPVIPVTNRRDNIFDHGSIFLKIHPEL